MARNLDVRVDALEEGLQTCRTLLQLLASQHKQAPTTPILNVETTELIAAGETGTCQVVDFDPSVDPRTWITNGPNIEVANWNPGPIPAGVRSYAINRPWGWEMLHFWNLRVVEFALTAPLAFADRLGTAQIQEADIGGGPVTATVSLFNPFTHSVGLYRYKGGIGDCGTGIGPVNADNDGLLIIDMECVHV